MNELQLDDGRTITIVQDDSDPLAYIDVLLEAPKLKSELSELRILVDELREFKNNVLSLAQIGEGSVGLTVLLATTDHKWLVTHRKDNRRDRLSDYCDTPEEAIKQALARCSACKRLPHVGWPGEGGGEVCQGCWEKQCSKSWWEAVRLHEKTLR